MTKSQLSSTHELIIEGMSCGHCVMAVKKALSRLAGVTIESVEVGKARIAYDEKLIDGAALTSAVEDAGFRLVEIR